MAERDGDDNGNTLNGTSGSDRLFGRGGSDGLFARAGDDYLFGGDGSDQLYGDSGADRLYGGSGADQLEGGFDDDVISDGSGGDIVLGGGGNDLFIAGPGPDLYDVTGSGSGIDTVSYRQSDAGVAVTLFDTDGAVGGAAAGDLVFTENIVGSPYDDFLTQNSSFGPTPNLMDGGAGADQMAAGRADDTYVVDNPGDVVNESAGEGNDTIESSIDYTLPNHVETLRLTGSADLDATGDGDGDTLIGNSGDNRLNGLGGDDTLRGGAGDDTYVNPSGDTIDESSDNGTDTVESDASYTLPDYVEDLILTGSGDLDGTGNVLDNELSGNSGANRLDGRGGADLMAGRAGDDTYVVAQAGDRVREQSGNGTDAVESAVGFTLPGAVEALTLTGSNAIDATGNDLDNTLTGNTASNVLDGGPGADDLSGGAGDDTYILDDSGDSVTESAGDGVDTVRSSVGRGGLAANVENLTLTGTGDIDATGNALDNTLTGNAGANRLAGAGGRDRLIGGDGDDIYAIANTFDAIVERPGGGSDTVEASVSYELDPHLEIATLTAAAGGATLTGNAQANTLTGNADNNELYGGGGINDLSGGSGDDFYYLQNADTTVDESAGGGTDRVFATVSDTLAPNVEEMRLQGSADLDARGNALDNRLGGNSAANELDGQGGADTLLGYGGDDTYIVDNAGDSVSEGPGNGRDTVESSVDWTLSSDVENLVLTGGDDLDGTGNAGANTLTGNAGANVLDGAGGTDSYAGGAGNDTYIVDARAARIDEAAGAGADAVESSVSFALPAHVEALTLTGSGDIDATGNAQDNSLTGNAGDNLLEGGAGADAMAGNAGHDVYRVDQAADSVVETAGNGFDRIATSISPSDPLPANVEALSLRGRDDLDALGNAADNALHGNPGDNRLDGLAGADRMAGGRGDDTYVVDDAGDAVIEVYAAGTDTVETPLSYTLDPNVEALTLTAGDDVNATGNALDNTLTGNDGDNVLTGGAGADAMDGGGGTDTASYADARDGVAVRLWRGTGDRGEADGDSLSGIENVTGGKGDDRLAGSVADNVFRPGAGDDWMAGGAGANRFVFEPEGGRDVVRGFVSGRDTLDLTALDFADAGAVQDAAETVNGSLKLNLDGENAVFLAGLPASELDTTDVMT